MELKAKVTVSPEKSRNGPPSQGGNYYQGVVMERPVGRFKWDENK